MDVFIASCLLAAISLPLGCFGIRKLSPYGRFPDTWIRKTVLLVCFALMLAGITMFVMVLRIISINTPWEDGGVVQDGMTLAFTLFFTVAVYWSTLKPVTPQHRRIRKELWKGTAAMGAFFVVTGVLNYLDMIPAEF